MTAILAVPVRVAGFEPTCEADARFIACSPDQSRTRRRENIANSCEPPFERYPSHRNASFFDTLRQLIARATAVDPLVNQERHTAKDSGPEPTIDGSGLPTSL